MCADVCSSNEGTSSTERLTQPPPSQLPPPFFLQTIEPSHDKQNEELKEGAISTDHGPFAEGSSDVFAFHLRFKAANSGWSESTCQASGKTCNRRLRTVEVKTLYFV